MTLVLGGHRPIDTFNRLLGVLAALALPGLGPALLFRPRPSWPLFLARAFLWGPFLAGVLMTLLDLAGLRALLTIAFPITGAAILVIAFIVGARREDRESPEEGPWEGGEAERHAAGHDDAPDPREAALNRAFAAAFAIGLALAVLVVLPPVLREWIRERGDSWFHAAVVQEILAHGVPPQDPYFAGMPLQYMWFFHEILVALHLLTGVSPFFVMIALNAFALIALCVLAADLARALWDDPRAVRGAALIAPLGLGVLFWVFFPLRLLRAFTGATGGSAALEAAFRLAPPDIVTTRAFLSNLGSSPFFLNKFLVGTAYGLALAFLLAYLASVVRWLDTGRRSHLACAGLSLLAMLLLHPVAGLSALALSGVTGVLLRAPRLGHPGIGIRRIAGWGIAAGAAFAIAAPYLYTVMRNKPAEQLVPFRFDLPLLIGLLAGCLFVLAASVGPLRDLGRRSAPGGRFFLLWIPAMIAFAAFVRLPGPNATDKWTYLVYLPLAVAAGAWAGRAFRGARGALLAVVLLGPANAIGYAGYWFDAAPAADTRDVAAAEAWIAAKTPPGAVIVEKEGRTSLLVNGPRRLYFARASYAEQWGYDRVEMDRRRRVLDALYGGSPGSVEADAAPALSSLAGEVYVVMRDGDGYGRVEAHPRRFQPVYMNGSVRVYRLIR